MIKGIGLDIIEISRIREAVEKFGQAFLNKVFTQLELDYCSSQRAWKYPELAVRFAAKEAYSKAVGLGIRGFGRSNQGLRWKEIEVANYPSGKPYLVVKGRIEQKAALTLSHSRDNAVAAVYLEK